MTRRARCAAAIIVVLASTACGVAGERRARTVADRDVPFELLDPTAPPLVAPAQPATATAPACFVRNGRVVRTALPVDDPADLGRVVAALATLPPDQPDLRTAVGDAPIVRGVRLEAGVAHVDLLGAFTATAGEEPLLAVAQIVCTLTAQPGVGRVAFTLEAAPIDVPRGDGSLSNEAVSRDDYATIIQ